MKQKGEFKTKKLFYKERQKLFDKIKQVKEGKDQVITYYQDRWLLSSIPFFDICINRSCPSFQMIYSYKHNRPILVNHIRFKNEENKPILESVYSEDNFYVITNSNFICYAHKLDDGELYKSYGEEYFRKPNESWGNYLIRYKQYVKQQ